MEAFLKRGSIISLIANVLFLVLGIILILVPEITLSFITYVVEIVLISVGIIMIINYIRVESKGDAFSIGFIQGIVYILLALFLIINPKFLSNILPITIGIWMLFVSIYKFQIAIKINSYGKKVNMGYIIVAAFMFVIAIFIIFNPFKTAAFMVQILGIGISIYAFCDVIENVEIIRFLNKI